MWNWTLFVKETLVLRRDLSGALALSPPSRPNVYF